MGLKRTTFFVLESKEPFSTIEYLLQSGNVPWTLKVPHRTIHPEQEPLFLRVYTP